MVALPSFAGRKVAVMGLGKSGLATAEALRAAGAEVWAWDDSEKSRAAAKARGFAPVDLTKADWSALSSLVLSPGIPHTFPKPHPAAALAKAHNVEIIGDIELLARSERKAHYIGITGTNGKSTTTALIGHILAKAGKRVAVGGNIGTPVLALEAVGDGLYVLEMSSYQLELTPSLVFDVAVLINVTPDHLDRHGGMDGYVAAKRLVFRGQKKPQTAVIGVDDEHCRRIHAELVAQGGQVVIPISASRPVERGVYVLRGILYDTTAGGTAAHVADLNPIPTLPGEHNWQNAAAAYAACRAVGVDASTIAAALATYPGLAHRQELIAVIDSVPFVNDSKATNADAAAKALVCYDTIYWIAGGKAKEGGIASLTSLFPRIRRAYLIGEAAQDFARTLGNTPHEMVGTLAAAVSAAHRDSAGEKLRGAVVLLSPACASFDQFANFEARGDAFRALARALPGARVVAAGGRA